MEFTFPDKIEICLRMIPEGIPTGKALMQLGGEEYSPGYPHVLVKRPNESFIYRRLEVRDVFYFTYSSSQYPLFDELGLFKPPLAWDITRTPEINQLISRLHDYLNVSRSFGSGDRIDVLCFQLLTEVLLMKHEAQIPLDPEREQILQIDSYFRLHFAENISLEDIAGIHGLSRTAFFRN